MNKESNGHAANIVDFLPTSVLCLITSLTAGTKYLARNNVENDAVQHEREQEASEEAESKEEVRLGYDVKAPSTSSSKALPC